MAKHQFLKKFIPSADQLKNSKYLKVFGKLLDNPHLWHFNRRSVSRACSIGLFITYIPFVGHMLLAALCAIFFRANLPISIALVWVINPLTMIPMFGLAYMVGALLLGLTWEGLDFGSLAVLQQMWQPFVLGCFICGIALAILGNIATRLAWRYHINKKWQARRRRQLAESLSS